LIFLGFARSNLVVHRFTSHDGQHCQKGRCIASTAIEGATMRGIAERIASTDALCCSSSP
jgi:hypothetical protein